MKNVTRFGLLFVILFVGCTSSTNHLTPRDTLPPIAIAPAPEEEVTAEVSPPYQTPAPFDPESARYYDLIHKSLTINEDEYALLVQNGFVLTDRITWNRFLEAYAWIYWQDLPVFVTTDSILHALHQSYGDILADLERFILQPELEAFLQSTHAQVLSDHQRNTNPELDQLYADVETYLTVALALLNGQDSTSSEVSHYVSLAGYVNSIETVSLFGTSYQVDFTLFQPRGYYVDKGLSNYFRAMSWMSHIDFRFVTYDPASSLPQIHPEAISAAFILQNAIEQAGERERWQQMNQLIAFFAGQSDNIALPDLERFLSDLNLQRPADVLVTDEGVLLAQLEQNDYGQQRIIGQLIGRHESNNSAGPVPRPHSFMLFGQRFSIDAHIMSQLVYDRLMVDGVAVERPLPAAMDVIYALGNNRAAAHLEDELTRYGYEKNLAALRQQVDELEDSFWQAPLYNRWLYLIRTLNQPTTEEMYPTTMRSSAWADKTLHTQLASWAQLRHDNILYTKQSITTSHIFCEYPSGYVEPYPGFYAALRDLAAHGHTTLSQIKVSHLHNDANHIRQKALHYFERMAEIADQLQALAVKELQQEPFTSEEELFVKSIVVRQDPAVVGCGGPAFDDLWDGWYVSLFYLKDDNPAVIADIHTNPTADPNSSLYPPRVMHVSTGPTAALLFLLETEPGTALYLGPAFTYFEVVEEGTTKSPPARLTDQDWRRKLNQFPYPASPVWSTSFRLPADRPSRPLTVPRN